MEHNMTVFGFGRLGLGERWKSPWALSMFAYNGNRVYNLLKLEYI
jgi:hypothetical protein